jgi:predicted NACHT family NTPase
LRSVDAVILARTWQSPPFEPVPNDFSWQKLCRRYQSAAKTILRESDELRRILDSKNLESIKEDTRRMAGRAPGFDLNKYRDGLLKRYANLRLESLETSGADHPPIQLWKIFIEQNVRECQQFNPRAYELPKEHQRRLRERGALEGKLAKEQIMHLWEAYFRQSTDPVLKVLKDSAQRLFVVLGDPGSGKSVLLEYLALRWANLETVHLAAEPIPLLIELKSYVENLAHDHCRDLVEYLDHGMGTAGHLDQHQIHAALERGDAWLLLDGLDEVFDPQTRQTVVADIVRYTTQ